MSNNQQLDNFDCTRDEPPKTPRKRTYDNPTYSASRRARRTSLFKPDAIIPLRTQANPHKRRRKSLPSTRDLLLSESPASILLSPKHTIPLLKATPRTTRIAHALQLTKPIDENGNHPFSESITKRSVFLEAYASHLPNPRLQPRGHQMSSLVHFNRIPLKVLDAPSVDDDFYVNGLSWSHQNVIGVALENSVQLYNVNTSSVSTLCRTQLWDIKSIEWAGRDGPANTIAVGLDHERVCLHDASRSQSMSLLQGPENSKYTGGMAWFKDTLAVGFGNGTVKIYDTRLSFANSCVATLSGHGGRVCGAKWNHDGTMLATGGNDDLARCWDVRNLGKTTDDKTQHKALWKWSQTGCVKALAWCPWNRNVLATGGGSGDGAVYLRSAVTGETKATVPLIGQVTSIHFSAHCKEFVCTTGYSPPDYSVQRRPNLPISMPGIQNPYRLASGFPDPPVLTAALRPLLNGSPTHNRVMRYRSANYTLPSSSSGAYPEDPARKLHDTTFRAAQAADRCQSITYITRPPPLNPSTLRSKLKSVHTLAAPTVAPSTLPMLPNSIVTIAYPSLERVIAHPYAHYRRILMSAMGPDGTCIVTSGDQMLKFWRLWGNGSRRGALSEIDDDCAALR